MTDYSQLVALTQQLVQQNAMMIELLQRTAENTAEPIDDLEFCEPPQSEAGTIYVNKSGRTGTLMYYRKDGENVGIPFPALKCKILDLNIATIQSGEGEEKCKCWLTVLTSRGIVYMESGNPFPDPVAPKKYPGNIYSRGLISAILAMSDEQLHGKVWIAPDDTNTQKDTILFCRIYDAHRNLVVGEWRKDERIDWHEWAQLAMDRVRSVCGGHSELPYPLRSQDNSDQPTPQSRPAASSQPAPSQSTADLSEIIAQTGVEMKRLGWSVKDGRAFLRQKFNKESRQQLTEPELLGFLDYLKRQPTPAQVDPHF